MSVECQTPRWHTYDAHPIAHDEARWFDPAWDLVGYLGLNLPPHRWTGQDVEPRINMAYLQAWIFLNADPILREALSRRELVVLELNSAGVPLRDIANGLGLRYRTVRTCWSRAQRKLARPAA